MLYFQAMTMGKICLVGRKTYESFGPLSGSEEHGLRGRHMVVVSTTLKESPGPHTSVAPDVRYALGVTIPELLASSQGWHPEVMVLGGEQIYQQVLDDVDRIYLTLFRDVVTKDGDTFFPYLDHRWVRVSTRGDRCVPHGDVLYNLYLRRGSPGTV
jgi:dihydrofolate reductase